jgi:hypothetical protein
MHRQHHQLFFLLDLLYKLATYLTWSDELAMFLFGCDGVHLVLLCRASGLGMGFLRAFKTLASVLLCFSLSLFPSGLAC